MKKLFLSILLIKIISISFSQPSKREIIREMLPMTEIAEAVAQSTIMFNYRLKQITESNEQLNPEHLESLINIRKEGLIDSLITIYDSLFTYEEIQQLSKYYKSPDGKKFKDNLPIIILRTMKAGQNWYLANHGILQSMFDSLLTDTGSTTDKGFIYEDVELQRDKPYKYRKKRRSGSISTSDEFAYKVYYNDKIWKEIDPSRLNPAADKAFKMVDYEVYGLILAESNNLNLKALRYTAIFNLHEASENYEILHNALRRINRNEVLSMQFKARVNFMDIRYHNYYFTDNSTVIQFSTFSMSRSYEKSKSEMENLLNGLVIIK